MSSTVAQRYPSFAMQSCAGGGGEGDLLLLPLSSFLLLLRPLDPTGIIPSPPLLFSAPSSLLPLQSNEPSASLPPSLPRSLPGRLLCVAPD